MRVQPRRVRHVEVRQCERLAHCALRRPTVRRRGPRLRRAASGGRCPGRRSRRCSGRRAGSTTGRRTACTARLLRGEDCLGLQDLCAGAAAVLARINPVLERRAPAARTVLAGDGKLGQEVAHGRGDRLTREAAGRSGVGGGMSSRGNSADRARRRQRHYGQGAREEFSRRSQDRRDPFLARPDGGAPGIAHGTPDRPTARSRTDSASPFGGQRAYGLLGPGNIAQS